MKKWIVWLLVIIMLLSACAKPAETPETLQPETAETAEPPESASVPEVEPEPEDNLFVFTRENLPGLDGSTSMVPLGEAVVAALLGESQAEVADLIDFHRTTESFRYLMRGESDLLLVAEPNQIVFEEMAQQGFEYEMEPIAKEALVFIVNSDNPIQSLTVEQLQGIYTGQITNWSQVGGSDVDIVPFQRNSTSGSQVLMDKLVMGDLEMMEAPQEWIPGEMDSLMQGVRGYEDSAAAIGYSVYYYAEDMRMADGMKIISIEGVEPTDSTIADGSYPLINYYFSVIGADAEKDSSTRILFDWLRSTDGQTLLESQGYVPVGVSVDDLDVYMDTSGLTGFDQPVEIFTRRTEEFVDELVPGDYGLLRPYVGSRAAFDMTIYGGQDVFNGSMGLIDDTGAIVVDAVYADVRYLYDGGSGSAMPYYLLSKEVWQDNDWGGYMRQQYGFCTLDGTVAMPCEYEYVTASNGYLIAVRDAEKGLFQIYDREGALLLDSVRWNSRPSIYAEDTMIVAQVTENLISFSVLVNQEEWDLRSCVYDWNGNLLSSVYNWIDLSGDGPYPGGFWATNDWGYLDVYGRPVLEQDYESVNPFYQGQALIISEDGDRQVIDSEGNVLWHPPLEEVFVYRHGDSVYYDCRTRDQKQIEIYDSNFCRLFPDAEKIYHLYSGHFMVWEGGNCTITDGSVSAELGTLSPVLNYYTDYQGSRDLILISCFFQNGQDYWLLDDQLRLIAEGMLENRGLEMKQDQIGNSSIVTWYPWGVNYPYSCEIFDYPGAPKLENVKVLGAYDGWYMVEDDFSSGYMDADGNWLFRVSLMADMTD